jgi:hypothetical protein
VLLLAYLGYGMGVVGLTWPLAAHVARVFPAHHDPYLFSWVMAESAHRLITTPLTLFHGNALYPHGLSLAFSEPLLVPAILGLPGWISGQPVLTYNLLLLTLWPLNGVAMAWAAHQITGSRPAAWVAGAVFCLSGYFSHYHVEFQMLLAAPIPLVLLAWVRWLENGRGRWLALTSGGLILLGLTTWYYTIILGVGLTVVTVGVVCLRWRGWPSGRRLTALVPAALVTGLVLLPVGHPYFVLRRELGLERNLIESGEKGADLLTFVVPSSRTLLWTGAGWAAGAEVAPFVGYAALALALASLLWLRGEPDRGRWIGRASRVALGALILALAGVVWAMLAPASRHTVGPLTVRLRVRELAYVSAALGIALLLLRGWAWSRLRGPRPLEAGDWARLLWLLGAMALLLAVGPVVHFHARDVGRGPYADLFGWFLPLHAIRVVQRFAVLDVAALALLAALGVQAIEQKLRPRPALRRVFFVALAVTLAAEYTVRPVAVNAVASGGRPVDAVLRNAPAGSAVLEWPTNVATGDTEAMFWSLFHGLRVVNGHSGFVPRLVVDLSSALTDRGPVFPGPEAEALLRLIYPLRYLVVRADHPDVPDRPFWLDRWGAVRAAPPALLRFMGTHGDVDLYEIRPLPERGIWFERWVSAELLRERRQLEVEVTPLVTAPDVEQWVDVAVNDRPLGRFPLNMRVALHVRGHPREAKPNVITLEHHYRRRPEAIDDRYRIGATGVRSPGELRAVSAGQPFGHLGSIRLNDVELAKQGRGYNLVALDGSGRVVDSVFFDTFFRPEAAGELAAWIAALPPGTVVAGAARDEASGRLSLEAVQALGALGVTGDLRGRFRESHAFIGVTGAPAGSAIEALGPRRVEVAAGDRELMRLRDQGRLAGQLVRFELVPERTGDR